jgi:hypothetical protein
MPLSSRPSEARAGTHNHRSRFGEGCCNFVRNNERLGLMGWTAPYGISVPE